jgi:hypothetical protein
VTEPQCPNCGRVGATLWSNHGWGIEVRDAGVQRPNSTPAHISELEVRPLEGPSFDLEDELR